MTKTAIMQRARPGILALQAYSSARSLHKNTADTVFLDANECPFEPFIGADQLSRYPDQQPDDLVKALCALYDVSSRNMAVMRGADEAIDTLLRVFCIPSQDNIIVCPPTFAMYEQAAVIQGAEVYKIPLKNDFSLDVDGVIAAADENTKLVFLCSPNNPTANLIAQDDIEKLLRHFQDTALVVVDETYIEYADQPSLIPEIENHPNLVVLRTLSKSFAAAGLRCGTVAARQEIIELMRKVLPPYPLPQPVVQVALQILDNKNRPYIEQKRTELLQVKNDFISELQTVDGVERVYDSDTNFVLVKVCNASDFESKCLDSNIIVRNQSYQEGLGNCLRISIGTKKEMALLVAALNGEKKLAQNENQRIAKVQRKTKETAIAVAVNLDAAGPVLINTGIGFYDHMLEQIAKHGGFSLVLECQGDLEIDPHHTVEDCAIALGSTLKKALGDKHGISRFGFTVPMDESLAEVALDLSGRFYLAFEGEFPASHVGDLPTDMVEHIFRSLAENLQATCHITVHGENSHHMVESCFKGFGRALRQAIRTEGTELPSTKGVL